MKMVPEMEKWEKKMKMSVAIHINLLILDLEVNPVASRMLSLTGNQYGSTNVFL